MLRPKLAMCGFLFTLAAYELGIGLITPGVLPVGILGAVALAFTSFMMWKRF
jgi:membrane-bound ClpP family serine protease